MTTPRFLIFDLDGTLIDSSAGVAEAVNYSLRMTGQAERPVDEISRYIGFPVRQMFADFGVGPFELIYRHFQDRAADRVVAKLGWADHFDALVGGHDVASPTPDPTCFRLAIARLNASCEESLVIGDTSNDVLAAQRHALPVVAVKSPYGGNDTFLASSPDYVIDKIAELPVLLKEIQRRKEAA